MAKLKPKKVETESASTAPPEPPVTAATDRRFWLCSALGLVAFFVIYLLRLDRIVGMFIDDAWYALLAKALATGQGYTLINSPTPGILPLYPPAYPFLLAIFFKLWPQFPNNIFLLKAVSIAAMLLTGAATYVYLERYRQWRRWTALLTALVTALSPGLAFMATSSLLSECVFAAAQMLALVAVEECVRRREGERFALFALLAGLACSAAFLTRSMAIGIVIAALLYLAKEKLFKTALVFAATVAVMLGSWTLYTQSRKPTAAQRAEVNNYIVRPYAEQFWDRLAGHEAAGRITLGELPERFWSNIGSILSNDAGGILLPALFPALNQGLAERGSELQWTLSFFAGVLVVAGYIMVAKESLTMAELALPFSLAIILAWPFPPYRFLLPSLPLLLFYFLQGTKLFWFLHRRLSDEKETSTYWGVLNGFAVLLLLLCLIGNGSYLARKFADTPAERPRYLRIFEEQTALLKWTAENVPKTDTVVTQNPGLVHLLTGNRTTTFDNPEQHWANWNQLGVRYFVQLSPTRLPEPIGPERQYRVAHRTGGELNLRVLDLGQPNNRSAWGAGLSNINLNGVLGR
ncbi:MAG: hypothetical protein HY011_04695 [Acidobacteria bacterium]|nr:hypothetical protein [Acidobacteriota bacterium]